MLITPEEVDEDRAMAEEQMIDRGRVTRKLLPSDPGYVQPVFNEATGQYDDGPPAVIYEGRCRIQVRADINSNAVEAVVGEHEWTYRTSTAQFPMFAGPDDVGDPSTIRSDDTLTIVASPLDAARVSAVLNLQADTKSKTLASHRRFRAKEVLS